ncbi:hypothetical protein SAMN05421805_1011298 [Saccharopolyspora antimicrobica]|uniref:Uncharacterized protein n=1 Tax=Saccharopolyspora antimicrobica TaxID=455193 RepID=A0A1I4T5R9_9PSEU|nr:hypothetical protein [Saccharopolyspora antimicrobica]RKT85850.1 hypothetical protein ATL45_4206 [Saccharopolyspora antimicrobica]SFM72084.1 hypothetical protein SAMN05421805_1011298 [Saccharopolyspora antimicrobica]
MGLDRERGRGLRWIRAVAVPGDPDSSEECAAVADLAYAVLLIGGFLVLALTLRGLERL